MTEMTSKLKEEDLEQIGQYLAEKYPILKSGTNQLRYSEIDLDIRERIVRVEEELKNQRELIYEVLKMMDKRFEEARIDMNNRFAQVDKRFEQVDKRFEQVEKRFEQVDKRFEQVDKRFEEMRIDMNNRFQEMRADTNNRFEQVDKRFEELHSNLNTRFNMMMWFMGLGFTIITAFIAGVLVILK